MTLTELSTEYRAQALTLRGRIDHLSKHRAAAEADAQQLLLNGRIRTLETMWREARDLAVLTEHYYDRGYWRNGRYTI